jgi:hypothetical protein
MDEAERRHWQRREREQGFVRLRLRLLPTEEGGRKGPIADGYRGSWDIGNRSEDDEPTSNDAPLLFDEPGKWLSPGESATARLHPLAPEFWLHVKPGLKVVMKEGRRVVGRGEVVEVVAPLEAEPSAE